MNNLTKVSFQFPNGNKADFETIGFVGAFIEQVGAQGARLGAFATGTFTPATITGTATAVVEAVAKAMMETGMTKDGALDVLRQLLPHAVDSAALREPDAKMTELETGVNPKLDSAMQEAIAVLCKL